MNLGNSWELTKTDTDQDLPFELLSSSSAPSVNVRIQDLHNLSRHFHTRPQPVVLGLQSISYPSISYSYSWFSIQPPRVHKVTGID